MEQYGELNQYDKLIEAGAMIVNQAGMSLLDEAYPFPAQANGRITQDEDSGLLHVRGPYDENLDVSIEWGKEDFSIHTDVYDSMNNKLSSKEETNGGTVPYVAANNAHKDHTEFRRADGSMQVQMDGISFREPKSGAVRDITGVITDDKGNYLGEMNLVAGQTAENVLNVTALYRFKQTYLGNVELLLTLDPNSPGDADIQISKKWEPPPPPVPKKAEEPAAEEEA